MFSAGDPICRAGMVYRPTGSFRPGSTEGDADEIPPGHDVTISAHCTDEHEFTLGDLARVLNGKPAEVTATFPKLPEKYNPRMPLANVTWFQADQLCRLQGKRLLTEMEWEYDAIGNTKAKFATTSGEIKPSEAQYNSGSSADPAPVCTHGKSKTGLCDMTGNMAEWTADWFHPRTYDHMVARDPQGPSKGTVKVVRGGSWFDDFSPYVLRVAFRNKGYPESYSDLLGFRCGESLITAAAPAGKAEGSSK